MVAIRSLHGARGSHGSIGRGGGRALPDNRAVSATVSHEPHGPLLTAVPQVPEVSRGCVHCWHSLAGPSDSSSQQRV